jgi:hypothetical protein
MTKIFADTADTVLYDPASWSGIINEPMEIARGLENCRQAYLTLRGLYKKLSHDEQESLFPDGLQKP